MLSSLPLFWGISAFSHTWKPRVTCWGQILAPPWFLLCPGIQVGPGGSLVFWELRSL